MVVLDEPVQDPGFGEPALVIGLVKEASLVAVNFGLDKEESLELGRANVQ